MPPKPKPEAGPSEQQVLVRILKDAVKSGKYTIGTRRVISELKTSKVVIAATSVPKTMEDGGLVKEAFKSSVPLVRTDKSSAELGKLMGRPFRVSAVALRVVAESDLKALVGAAPKAKASE